VHDYLGSQHGENDMTRISHPLRRLPAVCFPWLERRPLVCGGLEQAARQSDDSPAFSLSSGPASQHTAARVSDCIPSLTVTALPAYSRAPTLVCRTCGRPLHWL
jgi:hypothetical protein